MTARSWDTRERVTSRPWWQPRGQRVQQRPVYLTPRGELVLDLFVLQLLVLLAAIAAWLLMPAPVTPPFSDTCVGASCLNTPIERTP